MVFYVGKGHANRAYTTQSRNKHWHNIVAKHGVIVEIIAYWFTEEAAFEHEKSLIAEYRKLSQPLCNLTDGGEGPARIAQLSANAKAAYARRVACSGDK
jgi:hypothetical protein